MAKKKIRMLRDQMLDGRQYRSDDVISADESIVKMLTDSGAADDNKDAVKYCTETLGAVVITHEPSAVGTVAE